MANEVSKIYNDIAELLNVARAKAYHTVNSIMVVGTGDGGGHGWNYTQIDGKWYGVDVTWDDQNPAIYKYFLANKATMDEAHTPGSIDPTVDLSTEHFQTVLPELSTTKGYE